MRSVKIVGSALERCVFKRAGMERGAKSAIGTMELSAEVLYYNSQQVRIPHCMLMLMARRMSRRWTRKT